MTEDTPENFTVRIPIGVKKWIKRVALERGETMQTLVLSIFTKYMDEAKGKRHDDRN
jgi:hypothetical protein